MSALIEAGESVKRVQYLVGHKSAVTTLDIYGHMFPAGEDRTPDALDSRFGSVGESLANAKGGDTLRRRSDGM